MEDTVVTHEACDSSRDTMSHEADNTPHTPRDDDGGGNNDADNSSAVTATEPHGTAARADTNDNNDDDDSRRRRGCCVCAATAPPYTCPACARRLCSVTCVRVHTTRFACAGRRDVTAPVALAAFDDAQLRRDFCFLRDCDRVVSNAARHFPRTATRHTFRALPQPLFALREAARRRGVVCQIVSAGMHAREVNTSRYDVASNTIVWRCEWHFCACTCDAGDARDSPARHHHDALSSFVVATSWASERYRLRDILRCCWATTPPTLPCYPISLRYNRADDYVQQQQEQQQQEVAHEEQQQQEEQQATQHVTTDVDNNDKDDADLCDPTGAAPAAEAADDSDEDASLSSSSLSDVADDDDDVDEADVDAHACDTQTTTVAVAAADGDGTTANATAAVVVPAPRDDAEAAIAARVRAYLAAAAAAHHTVDNEGDNNKDTGSRADDMGVVVLARAERVGGVTPRYFALDLDATLHDNLRTLFFVTEYPVLYVVPRCACGHYTLVTAEDKAALRASLRRTSNHTTQQQQQQQQQQPSVTPAPGSRSTVPCRLFAAGRCTRGDACAYWHCARDALPLCRTWQRTGTCAHGDKCCFRHDGEAHDNNNSRSRGAECGRMHAGKRPRQPPPHHHHAHTQRRPQQPRWQQRAPAHRRGAPLPPHAHEPTHTEQQQQQQHP